MVNVIQRLLILMIQSSKRASKAQNVKRKNLKLETPLSVIAVNKWRTFKQAIVSEKNDGLDLRVSQHSCDT